MAKISLMPDVGSALSADDAFPIYTPNDPTDANKRVTAARLAAFTLEGNAETATKLSSERSFTLSGDVAGTVSSDLVSGFSITTAIGSGVIVDADIDASAAIALSKLATGALPTAITVASANIVDDTIVNADVSASAAIAGSKIAPDFGAQNVLTTGTITGASLNPTGTTVPVAGIFRPAANVLALATDTLERARVSAGGALLVGTTVQPVGQITGTILAANKLIIGSSSHGTSQEFAALVTTTITATTGSIVFNFKSSPTARAGALVRLSISHTGPNNTATNHPAAEYLFRLFNTNNGICSIAAETTIMEYQYIRATHFAFNNLGNSECTITLTNPTAVDLANNNYCVKIISNGFWRLETVTTT
jgi:hypothetical protein